MNSVSYCFVTWVAGDKIGCLGAIHYSDSHKVDVSEQSLAKVLNQLALDGWEMVGCGSTGASARYHNIYFKKQNA